MDNPPVLLIDEVDRVDEEFESFLLEILSDWQISIPELGVVKATQIPQVVVTSNRMRDLSEALRRRCFYLWIDYPSFEKELEIVCKKVPGIAESLDWAKALASLHIDHLDQTIVEETLRIVLKDWKDIRDTQFSLSELFEKVGVTSKLN